MVRSFDCLGGARRYRRICRTPCIDILHIMSDLTIDAIKSSDDEALFEILGKELERRISAKRGSPEFVKEIKMLPIGLRAMAATYELDVSLTLDDLGWHFGNWHNSELAEETARGLEELGATELAQLFRESFRLAQSYWSNLGADDWMDWYPNSPLEKELRPLNKKAWSIRGKTGNGVFKYWVDYARRHPERVGAGQPNSRV
jgi:hypothetical protein